MFAISFRQERKNSKKVFYSMSLFININTARRSFFFNKLCMGDYIIFNFLHKLGYFKNKLHRTLIEHDFLI